MFAGPLQALPSPLHEAQPRTVSPAFAPSSEPAAWGGELSPRACAHRSALAALGASTVHSLSLESSPSRAAPPSRLEVPAHLSSSGVTEEHDFSGT